MKTPMPFSIWLDRVAAARIRAALVFCNGNQSRAAMMIGIHRQSMSLILRRDNARMERERDADCPLVTPMAPILAAKTVTVR